MASKRISVRIGSQLDRQLRRRAKETGKNESAVVREALGDYLSRTSSTSSARTVYDLLEEKRLIGCLTDTPPDLSTNRERFEGFGESQ